MEKLVVETKKQKEVVDITDKINSFLKRRRAKDGMCHIVVLHTTCALTSADLDPGTDKDLLDAIDKMFPKGKYRHPHDPEHVGDHIMSSIIGGSLSIMVEGGELVLGTWQRIVLIEFSGPRKRNLILEFISSY